jgi:hypothetical protein
MTTAFVFITMMTVAHPVHMLVTVYHLLLMLHTKSNGEYFHKNDDFHQSKTVDRESGVRDCKRNFCQLSLPLEWITFFFLFFLDVTFFFCLLLAQFRICNERAPRVEV